MNFEGDFEVVVVALCERAILESFVQYFRNIGACKIRIFFDGVPSFDFSDPDVDLNVCDATFWADLGLARPDSIEARQRAIYRHAYNACLAPWCLIVDVDEYVFGPTDLSAYLAGIAPRFEAVRFSSAEAVYSDRNIDQPFGGRIFRKSAPRYLAQILTPIIYGRYGGVFIRGLLGHCRGKEALRAGIGGVDIDIHDAFVGGRPLTEHDASRRDGVWLAHYDAINFAQWCDKFTRRLARKDAVEMGKKRERQLKLFAQQADEAARRDLFCELYVVSGWKRRVLRALSLLLETGPQLTPHKPGVD